MQAHAVHAFHSGEWVMVAAPDRFRSLLMLLDLVINGQERGRTMVLRPIELNATGDPRAGQADQRRLDDVLVVDHLVVVGLIENRMNSPANVRQNHHAQELILDPYRSPLLRMRLLGHAIRERKRVNLATAALVHPVVEKYWVLIGSGWRIGRQSDFPSPRLDAQNAVFSRRVIVRRLRTARREARACSSTEVVGHVLIQLGRLQESKNTAAAAIPRRGRRRITERLRR
jgi:hypothetical protein